MKDSAHEKAVGFREAIKEHAIEFVGAVLPSQWPKEHVAAFQKIRDIDRVYYDELSSSHHFSQAESEVWKEKVKDIRETAFECRKQLANEQTWRLKMEHRIVDRLDSKLNW